MADPAERASAATDRHYGSADICARIDAALRAAGKDPRHLTRADLMPFDEFHGGGVASTRDLASYAGLTPGMRVLDVGCGIGGPARTLADEFGCVVSGIDLTANFIEAADMLTARLGFADRCSFQRGSATGIPFAEGRFDCVWCQNVMMNIADKARFFDEVARVLGNDGLFAFEAVVAGDGQPLHFPTFWAPDDQLNFLVAPDELRSMLRDAGLTEVRYDDTTDAVMANARKRRAVMSDHDPAALTIAVIVPEDAEVKMRNAVRNIEDGRTRTVKGLFRRTPG